MITLPTDPAKDNLLIKAVELSGVGKRYHLERGVNAGIQDIWALKGVSFDIYKGQVAGIIGRNGAGKTTLLNIIAKVLTPTEGEVLINGRALGLFNLGVGFQDELTGRENIFLNGAILGAAKKEIESKLGAITEFSELGDFINMPLGAYSQGMRLRLGFSVIANLDFDILVIDEVLAVGDALFQNKCFERLIEFRRLGKTLIISTQAMDLIERLCDKVLLLDHGSLLLSGGVSEGINKYRNLLNTEKFFVGLPEQKKPALVYNTKKWADNISDWGKRFGGKEILIDSVEFEDKRGTKTNQIKTLDPLKIRVFFTIRDKAENPHFGVAIFRSEGVYCYGPNTEMDGYVIPELKPGRGYFTLDYSKILLAPGDYKVSIAVWDKNESLAFDHYYGYYDLVVTGPDDNNGKELLNLPFEIGYPGACCNFLSLFSNRKNRAEVNPDLLADRFGKIINNESIAIDSVKFLGRDEIRKDTFMTNERVKFVIDLNYAKPASKGLYLWLGIYRDDGICCQGVTAPLNNRKACSILFPRFSLLPGQYTVSAGVWDTLKRDFIACHHGAYQFKMVFDRRDHGTVYMDHKWKWEAS